MKHTMERMIPFKDLLITHRPRSASGFKSYSRRDAGDTARFMTRAAMRQTNQKASTMCSLLNYKSHMAAALIILATQLTGCNALNNRPEDTMQSCALLEGHDPDKSFATTRQALSNGCEHRFDDYFARLLSIAEGDPGKQNKRRFSEFLVWSADAGIVSKRQATNLYNRYFNVKFVSLMGDYNNCSHTCPNRHTVIANMEQELADKEQGLLKVSADNDAYYKADHLFKETELVLEATCTACVARR